MHGEIMIWDSKPLISQVINKSETTSKQTFDVKAALFGMTQVTNWTTIKIPNGIDTYQKLQEFVAARRWP